MGGNREERKSLEEMEGVYDMGREGGARIDREGEKTGWKGGKKVVREKVEKEGGERKERRVEGIEREGEETGREEEKMGREGVRMGREVREMSEREAEVEREGGDKRERVEEQTEKGEEKIVRGK